MLERLRRMIRPASAGRRRHGSGTLIRLAALVAMFVVTAVPVFAMPGDFTALAGRIEQVARAFAGPFAVVAVVVVGSYVAMGHAQSGEQIRNLIIGLVFLGLALLGGTAILTMVGG